VSGNAAVPLCTAHTVTEIGYYLQDARPSVVVVDTDKHKSIIEQTIDQFNLANIEILKHDSVPTLSVDDAYSSSLVSSHAVEMSDPALFIYTSGTTGPPKGVVSNHLAFTHQITDLTDSWRWTSSDHILHFLPLHHIHGIQNKLNCALYSGASVEFMKFNPLRVWERLGDADKLKPTVFMGVPTVYAKLLETSRDDKIDKTTITTAVENMREMRLHVSGSAALPTTVMKAWEDLTHHRLLERYGMSEIGMALGNPYEGERHEGYVGRPFPSVQARIYNPETGLEVPKGSGSGELQIKGETVFGEYYGKPEATAKEFKDGWFCTGDIVEYCLEKESYKILGRASVDIIKSGGFKISALDIEREILEHGDVEECVVVGVDDDMKGEIICVLLRLKEGVDGEIGAFGPEGLRGWMKEFTAAYKLPSKVMVLDDIPKNVMGKYAKKELKKLFMQ
jgi:malonyl-CoA/methylmalonyl-CoA synthetase